MRNKLLDKTLGLINDIALKARVMGEWQASQAARKPEYSGRHMLILELAKDYAPITEKELGKIFGLSTSSINDLVERLVIGGLIEKVRKKEGDSREKVISLTAKGDEKLKEIKCSSAIRYQFLLNRFQEDDLEKFVVFLEKINMSVEESMRSVVFQQY